jgi:hypothetical protein
MKFNPLSTLFAFYWAATGTFMAFMVFMSYGDIPVLSSALVSCFSAFLFYGAARFLMREKPYTWKRERPFPLFMTKEERQEEWTRDA